MRKMVILMKFPTYQNRRIWNPTNQCWADSTKCLSSTNNNSPSNISLSPAFRTTSLLFPWLLLKKTITTSLLVSPIIIKSTECTYWIMKAMLFIVIWSKMENLLSVNCIKVSMKYMWALLWMLNLRVNLLKNSPMNLWDKLRRTLAFGFRERMFTVKMASWTSKSD